MSLKKSVFITRPIPPLAAQILKKKGYRVTTQPKDINLSRTELIAAMQRYDAILCLLTNKIDADMLAEAGDQLKIISNYAVGYDNIDIGAARERKIMVANTPCDEVSAAVSEHAMTLALSLSRRIVEADAFTRAGKYHGWDPNLLIGRDIYGTTLGVVGLGNIGKGLVQRAYDGFGMKILYTDLVKDAAFEKRYNAKKASLSTLLKKADIISLHVPLLPSTHHLISTKEVALMQSHAILVNTSRGPVVDEKAVLKALYKKKIGGFGLDVLECEPSIDCDPSDKYKLSELDTVIMTPHIASATVRARDKMAYLAAHNIISALSGKKPKNLIK